MSLRTLSRWKAALAADGAAGLDRRPRRDRGARRTDPRLVRQIEDLTLTKPRASPATIHRVVAGTAAHLGCPAPSYSTVRDIVNALDPGLVTLALEGPTSYRDKYELALRRQAERPNAMWQCPPRLQTVGAVIWGVPHPPAPIAPVTRPRRRRARKPAGRWTSGPPRATTPSSWWDRHLADPVRVAPQIR